MDSKKGGPFTSARPFRLWQGSVYAYLVGKAITQLDGQIRSHRIVTADGERVLVVPVWGTVQKCLHHHDHHLMNWAWCSYDRNQVGYVCNAGLQLMEYGCERPAVHWS